MTDRDLTPSAARIATAREEVRLPAIAHYVQPGQVVVTSSRQAIGTVLGSCVAVCLWDTLGRAGGMCHFVLPQGPGSGVPSARFSRPAIEQLFDQVLAHGAERAWLAAKLFGGARVLWDGRSTNLGIGGRNIEAANKLLCELGIDVVGADVAGHRGRKVIFEPLTGDAWVKIL